VADRLSSVVLDMDDAMKAAVADAAKAVALEEGEMENDGEN
jgi:hypothetical protein